MRVKLPAVVSEYFTAHNGGDADRVAACFAEGADVRDEGGDIQGREAIRAWAADTSRRYGFHADVMAAEVAAGRTAVSAHVTGDFPGSPVELVYRFTLAGAAISALEIG